MNLGFRRFASSLLPTIRSLFEKPPLVNTQISANGHIRSIRVLKNIGFITVSDGTSHTNLSIVFNDPQSVVDSVLLKVGQSIAVTGNWIESKGIQPYEVSYRPQDPHHKLSIIGDVPDDYPIQKKSQTLQFLRTKPTLRHRTAMLASILRFRSMLEAQFMTFFNEQHFTKVSPPIITSADCEGAGEQFRVEHLQKKDPQDFFFEKDAYLTVSTQLHLEMLTLSLARAWTLTPCFRAEHSKTNRHLSEFWMLEAELCYLTEVSQLTAFIEKMLKSVVGPLRTSPVFTDLIGSRFEKETQRLITAKWDQFLASSWPSITYTEALDLINNLKKDQVKWGESILTEHEKWLAGEHFRSPVFITDYPKEQKPFYMPHSADFDPEKPTVACFDLIVPEMGELVGGSLREHRYENLLQELKDRNMNIEDLQWYLSSRANGSVPHGGFGMGFERLICYLGQVENIKDVIPFPRAPGLCQC